jgi:Dolichyl-phosphate-mannose-protein mannosyltransferase
VSPPAPVRDRPGAALDRAERAPKPAVAPPAASPAPQRLVAGPNGWFLLLVVAAVLARLYHFTSAPDDAHQWRQALTLINIQSYSYGASLWMPRGDWYGLDWRVDVLELPVYSIIAFALSKVFGILTAARLESLALGVVAILLFDRTASLLGHPRRRTATVLFALAPISIFYSHSAQPDAMLMALLLGTAYCGVRALNRGGGWLLAAAVCIAVMSAIKPTAFITIALPLVYVGWRNRSLLGYGWVLASGLAAVVLWGGFDRIVLLTTNPDWYHVNSANEWVFGSLAQRLSPYTYNVLVTRAAIILLPPLTVGLLIKTAADRIGHPFWWLWVAGGSAQFFLFANLNIVHFYYQLPLVPALAALAAYSAPGWPARRLMRPVVVLLLLIATAIGCRDLYKEDPIFRHGGEALSRVATSGRPVIAMSGGGVQPWYPNVLYYTGRPGWVLPLDAGTAAIQELPGPAPCELVMVFDAPGPRNPPDGWQVTRRTDEYLVAHRNAPGCAGQQVAQPAN